MEGISLRMTPILKCLLLFLLVFTAKVLTSRPQESQDSKNGIQHSKASQYVRTFTKYHHRRTPQPEVNHYWPVTSEHGKNIAKRSVEIPNSNELISDGIDSPSLNQFGVVGSTVDKQSINTGKDEGINKNGLSINMKKHKVKAAIMVTDPPKVFTPGISCLYKIHSVALSATPSYDDDSNAQQMVESEPFDTPGKLSEMTLPSGEVVQVEQCTEPRATCYILWHEHDQGNTTVLGQGCWRASPDNPNACDKCTRVTPLPGTRFCCCTKSFCNADFLSIKEEIITPKAASTIDQKSIKNNYPNIIAAAILAMIAILVLAVAFRRIYCKPPEGKDDISDGLDAEKGDIMGSGPDALATGLSCVDNLTLIEHIGSGKFGSVWRGSLGGLPVAVKLFHGAAACRRESTIYALPHLRHTNILKYYGSDTRPALEGGSPQHLCVLELCACTLRSRLIASPVSFRQLAHLAHGVASALAHLHHHTSTKPCIVHRDINSNNVLISMSGDARLADLGLAQVRTDGADTRISEAGTLRYLSPEALEGAVDLSGGGRAALCAVDVFALGLVLWELLWRCKDAHHGATPPYEPPLRTAATNNVQNLVSRNKVRPPLPKGPVSEPRALKLVCDTCEECWDHDAEARLTAFCVEERMSELKQMLSAPAPLIHDNNLHPHQHDRPAPPETEKNSNVTRQCDVTTPLLYTHAHNGPNPSLQRNTHTDTEIQTHTLIHKSLKDITVPVHEGPRTDNHESVLSVARVNHNRVYVNENSNDVRSYQRPLDYVPNDVSNHDEVRALKETNLHQDVKVEKPKWGIRKFFGKKTPKETEVKLVQDLGNVAIGQNSRTKTIVVDEKPSNIAFVNGRPSNLVLNDNNRVYTSYEPCLSPPNKTLSPTMMLESENKVFGFKELPQNGETEQKTTQIFAVIVPKGKPQNTIEVQSSDSINKSVRTSMSAQSIFKSAGHSESEDSTIKKRLSCDNRIISNASNSGRSSRASINLELQYIDSNQQQTSPFDVNSDCSSSEDEHLMLLSENGSKITMQTVPKINENDIRKQNEVLKESSQSKPDFCFNKYQNKYTNFDNEYSDPNDKENLLNVYSGDNPVYLAAFNGEIDTSELKYLAEENGEPKSPKPKNLTIKRQRSLEQVSEIFSSSGDIHLQNPAGRVKTPGDLPIAVRKARRDRALQKGRANECNRLSLYDDRMMFGNSL